MEPSRRNRLAIIGAIFICISIVAIPLAWNFVQQNETVVLSRTIADVEIYPSYYRTEFYRIETAKMRYQVLLDTNEDGMDVWLEFEVYSCSLGTFDSQFRIEEEQNYDFRSEYLERSGAMNLAMGSDFTLSEQTYDGQYVIVFWLYIPLNANTEKSSVWTLSVTLSMLSE